MFMDTQTVRYNMTYKIQIDDLVRDATDEESAGIEAQKAEAASQEKAKLLKAKARQIVLDRLGITADEAQLLLG